VRQPDRDISIAAPLANMASIRAKRTRPIDCSTAGT
jgi:hypothetical protein